MYVGPAVHEIKRETNDNFLISLHFAHNNTILYFNSFDFVKSKRLNPERKTTQKNVRV